VPGSEHVRIDVGYGDPGLPGSCDLRVQFPLHRDRLAELRGRGRCAVEAAVALIRPLAGSRVDSGPQRSWCTRRWW